MKPRFDKRFSGFDLACDSFTDAAFGAKRDRRGFGPFSIALFNRRLQRFQLIGVHDYAELVVYSDMKHLQLIVIIACAGFLLGCESTQTAGQGSQEQKRMAALQQQEQEVSPMDEADRNLWNAQRDRIDRMNADTNPAIRY
jgi:hypothetical protein